MARVVLIEATPWLAADGSEVDVRLAGGGSKPYNHRGFNDWRAGIATDPRYVVGFGFGQSGWTGGAVPTTAAIVFFPSDAALLSQLSDQYLWVGAPITIRTGDDVLAPGAWVLELTGTVAATSVKDGALSIIIADLSKELNDPIVQSRFAGTGGLEGIAEAEGRPKRRSWGKVYNIEGRVLDKASNVYEFGDPAFPLYAFDIVKDKGREGPIAVLAWQGTAQATFDALKVATPPEGGATVAPSIACVKWWTTPSGPLTADLRGEIGGGYVDEPALIAEAVLNAAGGAAERTNHLANSAATGAVVGVIGAGGAVPVGWNWGAAAGVTRQVVGQGKKADGRKYTRLRISGTPSTTGFCDLYFGALAVTAAALGQVWTASVAVEHVAGSSSVGFVRGRGLNITERNAASNWIAGNGTNVSTSGVRSNHTRTLNNVNTAFVAAMLDLQITAGAAVDWTFDVIEPMLEKQDAALGLSYPTAYIETSGSPVTVNGVQLTNAREASAWRPDEAGLHIGDDSESAAAALDRLLPPASLLWVLETAGTMRLTEIGFDDPVETITIDSVERLETYRPIKEVKVDYRPNHRQHGDGEISAAILAADVVYDDGQTAENLQPAEPGATHGAPVGTPVGDRPAETVNTELDEHDSAIAAQAVSIADIIVDVDDLQATYGDTAAAAASAQAAQDAEDLAEQHAISASGSSSVAAGHASTAQAEADEATGAASTATAQANVAIGKAGEASASSSSAAASASDADGSAVSAASARDLSATYRDQALGHANDSSAFADASEASSVIADSHAAAALASKELAAQIANDSGIVKNNTFTDWGAVTGTVPTHWVGYAESGTFNAQAVDETLIAGYIENTYAIRQTCAVGQNIGFFQTVFPITKGPILLESAVSLVDGNIGGACVLCQYFSAADAYLGEGNINFGSDKDVSGRTNADLAATSDYWIPKIRRFRKIVEAPAGTQYVRLFGFTNYGPLGNQYKIIDWHSLNARPGAIHEAAVLNDAGAIVEVGKRAMSFWQIEANANLGNEATAFITARAEATPGVVSSEVAMGAREVHIYNEGASGLFSKAMSIVGGNVLMPGDLEVGGAILAGGRRLAIACQAFTILASDGQNVDFGGAVGAVAPIVEPDLSGLPALAVGSSYDVRPQSITPTGFFMYAKTVTSGAPAAVTQGPGTNVGGTPQFRMHKSDAADAANGYYTFDADGTANVLTVTTGDPGQGNVLVDCYVKSAGAWTLAGTLSAPVVGGSAKGTAATVWDISGSIYFANAIGQDAGGDHEFGISVRIEGSATSAAISDFNSVGYTKQTGASATSIAQAIPCRVTPQNA